MFGRGSFPGNFQRVARWCQSVESGRREELTPYLQKAAGYASAENSDTEIVMALDLLYAIDKQRILTRLPQLESLKGKTYSAPALADLLSSIEGVTLGIKLEDDPYGRVKVEFSQDTSMLEPFGKELMLEILSSTGSMIDDFNDWTFRVEGNQAYIAGKISAGGIRRLGALIEPPSLDAAEVEYEASDYEDSGMSIEAYATQQNFQAMTELVDDLIGKRRTASTSGQAAMWYERYARKIDKLPLANVDDALIDLNARVSQNLRAAATAKKNANARAGVVRKQSQTGMYRGDYGYYYDRTGNYANAAAAGVAAQGAMSSEEILAQMQNDISETRRELAKKYNVNF